MTKFVDFQNAEDRLNNFGDESFKYHCDHSPILRGICMSLIALQWEGDARLLSDVFAAEESDQDSFDSTLAKLNYQVNRLEVSLCDVKDNQLPAFISLEGSQFIFVRIDNGDAILYDYNADTILRQPINTNTIYISAISQYSTIFRELPPESTDKSNWVKHAFYQHNNALKLLLVVSFVINIIAVIQPFYIMGVYALALHSETYSTLISLSVLALVLAGAEFALKRLRVKILSIHGKSLSGFISKNVLSKLLWLPYNMTVRAGVSAQLERLKDIDQFRRLATSELTLSYFDLPFIILFIGAIILISPSAAIILIVGIIIMVLFGFYARYQYQHARSKSSKAASIINYQWNLIITNLAVIQSLPLTQVMRTRFNTASEQSAKDSADLKQNSSWVQNMGQVMTQIIGTLCICVVVVDVMQGNSNPSAMIAIIILIWKALTPIMSIYNSFSRFQTLRSSAQQINTIMSFNDDSKSLTKSSEIEKFTGEFTIKELSHRYPSAISGLTNLSLTIPKKQHIAISGPSGCGKTTLLNILAGIEVGYQGQVQLDGLNIKQFNNFRYRRAIHYIPSSQHLFNGSIRTNFIIHNGVMSDRQMIDNLTLCNLWDELEDGLDTTFDYATISDLSSGFIERLRIAIGLGDQNIQILLIEEPFKGIEKHGLSIMSDIIAKLPNATIVYTTSSMEIISLADKCLLLDENGAQKFYGLPEKVISSQR